MSKSPSLSISCIFNEDEKAKVSEINDPNAFALGTIDNNNYPTTRIVLLKDFYMSLILVGSKIQ